MDSEVLCGTGSKRILILRRRNLSMPRLNQLDLVCELSKTKTFNSVPVVEDGAKREGVVL